MSLGVSYFKRILCDGYCGVIRMGIMKMLMRFNDLVALSNFCKYIIAAYWMAGKPWLHLHAILPSQATISSSCRRKHSASKFTDVRTMIVFNGDEMKSLLYSSFLFFSFQNNIIIVCLSCSSPSSPSMLDDKLEEIIKPQLLQYLHVT